MARFQRYHPSRSSATHGLPVKRLRRRGGRVQLLAENPAYDPIESDDVQVLGKVVAVLRSL